MLRAMLPFFLATAGSWTALFIVAFALSKHDGASWIWTAALPAFFLETLFYLGSVMENTRLWFHRATRTPMRQAGLLWGSALLPFLALASGAGTFNLRAFLLLGSLSALFAFWYVTFPRRPAYDFGFLLLAAAPIIARAFPRIYRTPEPHLHLDILGHLMWIRVGLMALLLLRKWDPGPVSFWPRSREWRIGLLWFTAGALPIAGIAVLINDMHAIAPAWSWRLAATALGTFFAGLWVIGLSEELFFRGFVERALLNEVRWKQPFVGVAVSAVLFGAVHLWFRPFPDYRRFITVAVLGVFCGLAYWQARSVRASMVTHACAIVTMRLFFRG